MYISDITGHLESIAPVSLQEDYDNAGLLTGQYSWECQGVLCTLDVTEEVIDEAIRKNCNCIVAHHPLIFRGLKKINGNNLVERSVIAAIKNNIAIYAIHTNLDNTMKGVNGKMADLIGLTGRRVLDTKANTLKKLITYIPVDHFDKVRDAIFKAGAGHIGNYSECSFSHPGTGTFKPEKGTNPFSGQPHKRKEENEIRLEVILPNHRQTAVVQALLESHPYEEPAFDLVALANDHQETGAGIIGEVDVMEEKAFLTLLAERFGPGVIRHTALINRPVRSVALCGGAGSFLIPRALSQGADVFVTSDIKYHEFFGAEGKMLLCDIGHFESEQFTTELLADLLLRKFPNFAVLKSEVRTNPVHYFTGT